MSTVVKTKSVKKKATIASALKDSFREFKVDEKSRSITIACTPVAFREHGNSWFDKTRERISQVASEHGLRIANWHETVYKRTPALKVQFLQVAGGNIELRKKLEKAFQENLDSYLVGHDNWKGKVVLVSTSQHSDGKGSVVITYECKQEDEPTSRQVLRKAIKEVLKGEDRKPTLQHGVSSNSAKTKFSIKTEFVDLGIRN